MKIKVYYKKNLGMSPQKLSSQVDKGLTEVPKGTETTLAYIESL